MISTKNVANAVGGMTARPCDSCIRKRARLYCAADDAFLCQACDSSVHSANSLARRHHRVHLKTSSIKPSSGESYPDNTGPSWHRGFTRKARTPRSVKSAAHQLLKSDQKSRNVFPLVPEVGADENSHEENEEEHLLFRVPIFDPFVSELRTSATSNEATGNGNDAGFESKAGLFANHIHDFDSLHGFLPSDMDPAEFAADVESLLGRGLENECFGMEELGLMGGSDDKSCNSFGTERIKVEKEEACDAHAVDAEIDMVREQFELNFDDYDTLPSCAEEEDKVGGTENEEDNLRSSERKSKKRKAILRLNCDAVMSAWDSQVSPWSNGKRPDFEPDDCWPHCMGSCVVEKHHHHHHHHHQLHPYGEAMGGGIGLSLGGTGDGGREARVSRYREKRRTRLFSKKIRYEVRKLNAEKRPRMKGRFVKRASFVAAGFQMISNK